MRSVITGACSIHPATGQSTGPCHTQGPPSPIESPCTNAIECHYSYSTGPVPSCVCYRYGDPTCLMGSPGSTWDSAMGSAITAGQRLSMGWLFATDKVGSPLFKPIQATPSPPLGKAASASPLKPGEAACLPLRHLLTALLSSPLPSALPSALYVSMLRCRCLTFKLGTPYPRKPSPSTSSAPPPTAKS